ncbi:MAG: iron-sulfur cluster assembly scaffold protein [Candidatus Micrarchaeia archaeon]
MLYAEKLFNRYKKPLFKGKIEEKEKTKEKGKNEEIRIAKEENLLCGDKIKVYLRIEKEKIKEAKFEGSGCVISMGSADLLMEHITGKSLRYVKKLSEKDIIKLIGFTPDAARMHCATLALSAIRKIL